MVTQTIQNLVTNTSGGTSIAGWYTTYGVDSTLLGTRTDLLTRRSSNFTQGATSTSVVTLNEGIAAQPAWTNYALANWSETGPAPFVVNGVRLYSFSAYLRLASGSAIGSTTVPFSRPGNVQLVVTWFNAAGGIIRRDFGAKTYLPTSTTDALRLANAFVSPDGVATASLAVRTTTDGGTVFGSTLYVNAEDFSGFMAVSSPDNITPYSGEFFDGDSGASTVTNLVQHPTFITGTTLPTSSNATLAVTTYSGKTALRVTTTTAGSQIARLLPDAERIAVTPGESVFVSTSSAAPTNVNTSVYGVEFYDATGTLLSTTESIGGMSFLSATSWNTNNQQWASSGAILVPANAASMMPRIRTAHTVGQIYYITNVLVQKVMGGLAYFDGDGAQPASAGIGYTFAWSGAAGASTSTRTHIGAPGVVYNWEGERFNSTSTRTATVVQPATPLGVATYTVVS